MKRLLSYALVAVVAAALAATGTAIAVPAGPDPVHATIQRSLGSLNTRLFLLDQKVGTLDWQLDLLSQRVGNPAVVPTAPYSIAGQLDRIRSTVDATYREVTRR